MGLEERKEYEKFIRDRFDLSPRGIIDMLGFSNPIFSETSSYGHFGREPKSDGSFSWEKTDKKDVFNK